MSFTPSCASCRFYSNVFHNQCRRYPPVRFQTPDDGDYSTWPEVDADDYCGEYRKVDASSVDQFGMIVENPPEVAR